ncbi:MAG: elongation factor Ts [Clostridia bacterium]|nr:elongation factor Ts [Clostridia bacterium]MBQ2419903.1 elongation factor Ts [Clostridia bacterium]
MAFTAKDVQALREKTGCGMMDCKKALTECDGDMEKAVDFLREKGLAQQAKKAGRIAAEGAVLVYEADGVAAAVEINAETDFVAGGDLFKELTLKVAQVVAEQNPADVEALGNCALDGKTVNEAVQDLFLAVRENIKIRRFERFEGNVGSYVHGGGKIGVLVNFDTTAEVAATAEFKTLTKDIAMQIAAANPTFLDRDSVPAETIEHEKNIMISQMKEDPKMANKPEQVLAKIVEGKMGKYFSEVCLLEQTYVKDGDFTVGKYIESVAKKLGGDIKLVKYARLEKGEGLEKRSDNFADEVASMMK